MVTDLTIENTANNKKFLFRAVSLYKPKKLQPPIKIPLINTAPEDTILFKFVGQSEQIIFTFAIYNDGVDVSDGSESGGVTTVPDQIKYLKDDVFTKEFDTLYSLTDNSGIVYSSAIGGVITSLDFDLKQGAQVVVTGTLIFDRGALGGL